MKLPRTIDTRRDALFWLVLIVVVSLLALSESAHVRMVAIGLFFLFLGGVVIHVALREGDAKVLDMLQRSGTFLDELPPRGRRMSAVVVGCLVGLAGLLLIVIGAINR